MSTTPPFKIIGDSISHDTRSALVQLLRMSKDGGPKRLIGLAFAGMILSPDGRHYFTNASGEMYRNPDVARGYVAQLDDCLGQLSRGQVPFGWQ